MNLATYTKKGRFNLNHPLMCVASKMPLILSPLFCQQGLTEQQKNPRTPQKTSNMVMQCFRSSRVHGNFFLVEKPVAQALCLNGGKEKGKNHQGRSEPPEAIKRQNLLIWLQHLPSRHHGFPTRASPGLSVSCSWWGL